MRHLNNKKNWNRSKSPQSSSMLFLRFSVIHYRRRERFCSVLPIWFFVQTKKQLLLRDYWSSLGLSLQYWRWIQRSPVALTSLLPRSRRHLRAPLQGHYRSGPVGPSIGHRCTRMICALRRARIAGTWNVKVFCTYTETVGCWWSNFSFLL